MRIAAALILATLAAIPAPSPSAREQFDALQSRVRTAISANDQQARIAADLDLLAFLHQSPDAVEALARAYAAANNSTNAIATLNRYADLGLASARLLNGADKAFSPLAARADYKQVLDRFRSNQKPVLLGATAITFSDPGLLTEDIDFDPSTRSFLVTSVLEHKIVRATLDGRVTNFASSPDGWPMLAIKVDAAHHRVWATQVALDDFAAAPKDAWGRSALLCFDLKSGDLLRRIDGPPHTALGDMVLTSAGDPILSDGLNGGLYRLSGSTLAPLDTTEFLSPQTPARASSADDILIPDYLRGIALLHHDPNRAINVITWLEGSKAALTGVDGLYLHNRTLILTQNGTAPQRILRLELDPALTGIVSSKVIAQGAATDPTHGVVVGDNFYYIENSGWNQLDDHGNVKEGSRLTPARIMRYSLR